MIRTKQGHERVRHSVYWKPETKELLERKSEELNMSQNSSVTATSSYIGVTDNSALDLARTYSF